MNVELSAKYLEHDWDEEKLKQIGEPLGVCVTFGPIKAVIKEIEGKKMVQILTQPQIIFKAPEIPKDGVMMGEGTFSLQGVREVLHNAVEKCASTHGDGVDVGVELVLLPLEAPEESDTSE
jgi:hypothetical protein